MLRAIRSTWICDLQTKNAIYLKPCARIEVPDGCKNKDLHATEVVDMTAKRHHSNTNFVLALSIKKCGNTE